MKSIAKLLKYEGLLLTGITLLVLFLAVDMFARFWYVLLLGPVLLAVGVLLDLGSVGAAFKKRTSKQGLNAVFFSVFVVAIVAFINAIALGHEKTWDGTSAKIHTLSAQTVKVLQHLKAPVKVTGFFATGEDKGVKSLLERYDAAAPPDMFGFEIIDPDQHPEVLQKYDVNRRGAIVVETGGRNTIIVEQTEQGLTQAILKITQAKTGPVCFVTGHGEASINDAEEGGASLFKRLLENENHDTQEIVLAGRGIPEECSVAVLAGPDRPMAENEVRVVEDWVDRGGSLLYLAEPTASAGLEDWLAQRGVTLDDVIIVEPVNNPFFGSQLGVTPVVMDYPAHDITKDMTQPTLFSLARSLTLNYSVDTAMVSPILNTTDQAWGEVDVKPLLEDQVVERDEKDGKGPLVLGAALEVHSQHTPPADPDEPEGEDAPATPASARVVVIGDSTFLRNGLVTQLYNSDFALNVVAWLAGKEETISIRPNQFESSMILLTGDDRAQVFFISVLAVPMFVTMFGIGVILSRSRRSNA